MYEFYQNSSTIQIPGNLVKFVHILQKLLTKNNNFEM